MGLCSRECATERSVEGGVENESFVGCDAVRANSSLGTSFVALARDVDTR